MASFDLLMHANRAHELALKQWPSPLPLSHPMGEGGRRPGEGSVHG